MLIISIEFIGWKHAHANTCQNRSTTNWLTVFSLFFFFVFFFRSAPLDWCYQLKLIEPQSNKHKYQSHDFVLLFCFSCYFVCLIVVFNVLFLKFNIGIELLMAKSHFEISIMRLQMSSPMSKQTSNSIKITFVDSKYQSARLRPNSLIQSTMA